MWFGGLLVSAGINGFVRWLLEVSGQLLSH